MLRILHAFVVTGYVVAPILAMVLTIARIIRRRTLTATSERGGGQIGSGHSIGGQSIGGQSIGARSGGGRFTFTISAAIILGSAVSLVYAVALGGHIAVRQVLLSIYFTASLMFLLGAFDALVVGGLKWLWTSLWRPASWPARESLHHAINSADALGDGTPRCGSPPPGARQKLVESLPFLIRAGVLIAVALPYLMATALTYRPKIVPRISPATQIGYDYEPVSFQTADGYTIAAWWIPAAQDARASSRLSSRSPARLRADQSGAPPRGFGRETVVLCHGIGSGKAGVLSIARPLLQHGYNVLALDFRAHGESDGQLTSLGSLERQDVLAAVRWLRDNRARDSVRILGVGVSTGAAALIAAAADPSDEGQAIEAIAVYEGFDNLASLGRTVARERFLPPLSWVADRIGLALASAQVGADLVHFSPAEQAAALWPRPIFFIHGGADQVIPFARGQALFDTATEPKRCLWLPMEDYGQSIENVGAAREVRDFLDEARPVPAI